MTPGELLQKYILFHNYGIESGDFAPMLELFDVNAVIEFEDERIGKFEGIEMIAGVFRRQSPTLNLSISDIKEEDDTVTADYSDENDPNTRLGSIKLESDNRRIKRLYICQ